MIRVEGSSEQYGIIKTCFKKKILVQVQGMAKFQTGGIAALF